ARVGATSLQVESFGLVDLPVFVYLIVFVRKCHVWCSVDCPLRASVNRTETSRNWRRFAVLDVENHARGDQAAGDIGVPENAQNHAIRRLQTTGQDVPYAGHARQDQPGENDQGDARAEVLADQDNTALNRR